MEGDRPPALPHRGSGSVQGLSAGPKGGSGRTALLLALPPPPTSGCPLLALHPGSPCAGGYEFLLGSALCSPPQKKAWAPGAAASDSQQRTPPPADAPGPGTETGKGESRRRPAPGCSSVPPGARGGARGPARSAVVGRGAPRAPVARRRDVPACLLVRGVRGGGPGPCAVSGGGQGSPACSSRPAPARSAAPERSSRPGGAPCRPPRAPGGRRGGAAAPLPTPGAGQASGAAAPPPAALGLSCLTAQAGRCAPSPRCSAVLVLSGRRVSVWQYFFFLCRL